jgi:hypothetical protein
VPSDVVSIGPPIPALDRMRLFSPTQWEDFVYEWADSLRQEYSCVERCGGAGDMGRDIVAVCPDPKDGWDNYQCKHYDHPLYPSDILVELGKLIYYTYQSDYTYPRRYYFVAPQGAGTTLSNLIKRPEVLRSELLSKWDAKCRDKITATGSVDLDFNLKAYVESLDFSIFQTIPPLRILDQHAKTRWFVARFGGGLPARPPIKQPPNDPAPIEARYLRQLLDAYGDYLHTSLSSISDITHERGLQEHFNDSRLEFYSAESLRMFSRDWLPPDEFERLQDEVYSGVADEIRSNHPDGYQRLLAVVKAARALQITAHALVSRLSMRDRGGICHQLANDDKVRWVK